MKQVKTKRIKSKKEKMFILYDLLFLALCIIIMQLRSKGSIIGQYIEYLKIFQGNGMGILNVSIGYFWMIGLGLIVNNFIWIAVYMAFRISRMKVIRENSKYRVIDNIEYFRDRFHNITPTEISLIADLEIETKKDLSAAILNLYQKQIIDFSDNQIVIKNENISMRQSEKILVEMIRSNDFFAESIQEWKAKCIEEAKADKYIREKKDTQKGPDFKKSKKIISICVILLISSVLIGGLYIFSPEGEEWSKQVDLLSEFDIEGQSETEMMQNNEEARDIYIELIAKAGPIMLATTIMFISLFTLIGIPIYRGVRRRIYNQVEVNNRFERTEEGEILVEQIAGIKNFIHDFSLLSEKEKESIVLWEDFLIYAVVLEENEKITKDIFRYKNVNLDIWKNMIAGYLNSSH